MSDQLLKQLGVEQQILQQMVDERAALAEADRLGVSASDEEVRQRIFSTPAFQENGAFIGEQRYQQLLRMQRPPLVPSEFEESVRRQIIVDKLRASLTDWLSVPDRELEQEYRRRNDKVKLAVVSFTADSFRGQVAANDAEVASYFDGHKNDFKIPEKRKIRYLLIDIDAVRAKVTIPPADVERAYNNGIDQYTTPEQVRASHILLKTEGKDDAAVKAKAEELLKQARAGADFADLAKKNSEDDASAKNGGDLDYFGRGRMVPEFDAAVFAMAPGQISDLVKTQYGYHIIKLVDKKTATTRTLAEVRQQITDQLAYERAQAQAADLSTALEKQISKPADLDKTAKAQGLTVQESGFFARDEPILGLGPSPEGRESRVRDEAGRRRRTAARVARVRLRDAGREAGSLRAEGRGSQRQGARRSDQAEGARGEPAEGERDRGEAQVGAGLRKGGKGRRGRGQDDRPHRARRADSGSGRRARRRRRGVQARRRCGQRSDPDRYRHRRDQGPREERSDDGRVDVVEGSLPRGVAHRPPQPLFLRLHGEGEAEDEIDVNRESLQRAVS